MVNKKDEHLLKSLSARLALALEAADRKASQVARAAGITPSYLSHLLKGKNANPSPEVLGKICDYLSVRVEWLRDGQEPMHKPHGADARAALARGQSGPIQMPAAGPNPELLREIEAIYPQAPAGAATDPDVEISEILVYCNSLFGLDDPSPTSVRLFATAIRHHARRLKEYLAIPPSLP